MEQRETECCTPNGQIKRYKDCIGCDKKPLELNQNKMKAKLIKREDGLYFLHDENGKLIYGKLSLKNCEAIVNGYDLDELAENLYLKSGPDGISDTLSFKIGFQKALEILGDKKFSEEDMKSIFEYGWNQRHYDVMDETKLERIKNRYIQSLQKTEWDVEIEERELSLEERKRIYEMEYTNDIEVENNHWLESKLKTRNIPTKLITLTYNNETIESYE